MTILGLATWIGLSGCTLALEHERVHAAENAQPTRTLYGTTPSGPPYHYLRPSETEAQIRERLTPGTPVVGHDSRGALKEATAVVSL